MAKVITVALKESTKKKRPRIHSKNGSSKLKGSKNYLKLNRGQGR